MGAVRFFLKKCTLIVLWYYAAGVCLNLVFVIITHIVYDTYLLNYERTYCNGSTDFLSISQIILNKRGDAELARSKTSDLSKNEYLKCV